MEKKVGLGGTYPIPSPLGWNQIVNTVIHDGDPSLTWNGKAGDVVVVRGIASQGNGYARIYLPSAVGIAPEQFIVSDDGVWGRAFAQMQGADGQAVVGNLGYNGDKVMVVGVRPTFEDNALPRMDHVRKVIGVNPYVPPIPYSLKRIGYTGGADLTLDVIAGDLIICVDDSNDGIALSGVQVNTLAVRTDTESAISPYYVTAKIAVVAETGMLTISNIHVNGSAPYGAIVLRPEAVG